MNTHADRDGSEPRPRGITIIPTWDVPAGPPLHEPTDRDADNVPSDEEQADIDKWRGRALLWQVRAEKAEAEVERLRADLDAVEDEKTALYHDRQGVIREVERLRATTARVEALRDDLYREHDGSLVTSDYPMIARRIDAALRGPEPTEETP